MSHENVEILLQFGNALNEGGIEATRELRDTGRAMRRFHRRRAAQPLPEVKFHGFL